jgi:hypothetical protein
MTPYATLVSTAVYLALNLMIFGTVIALVATVTFKLLPTTLPRARYLVAIAAFCAASALPLVEQRAVEAARRWRFTPATMEGQPIKVIGVLNFFGQMDRSKQWIEIR